MFFLNIGTVDYLQQMVKTFNRIYRLKIWTEYIVLLYTLLQRFGLQIIVSVLMFTFFSPPSFVVLWFRTLREISMPQMKTHKRPRCWNAPSPYSEMLVILQTCQQKRTCFIYYHCCPGQTNGIFEEQSVFWVSQDVLQWLFISLRALS